jgi:hypothetical protein
MNEANVNDELIMNDELAKSCKYNLSAIVKRINGTVPVELLTDVHYGASMIHLRLTSSVPCVKCARQFHQKSLQC